MGSSNAIVELLRRLGLKSPVVLRLFLFLIALFLPLFMGIFSLFCFLSDMQSSMTDSGTHSVDQGVRGLKAILLNLPFKCQDYRCVPAHLASLFL